MQHTFKGGQGAHPPKVSMPAIYLSTRINLSITHDNTTSYKCNPWEKRRKIGEQTGVSSSPLPRGDFAPGMLLKLRPMIQWSAVPFSVGLVNPGLTNRTNPKSKGTGTPWPDPRIRSGRLRRPQRRFCIHIN